MSIVKLKFTTIHSFFPHELTATGEIIFVSKDGVDIPLMTTEEGCLIEVKNMQDLAGIEKGDSIVVDDEGKISRKPRKEIVECR